MSALPTAALLQPSQEVQVERPALPYITGLEVRGNWIHKAGETECVGTAYGAVKNEDGSYSTTPEAIATAKLWAVSPILAELFFAVEELNSEEFSESRYPGAFKRFQTARIAARTAMAEVMAC